MPKKKVFELTTNEKDGYAKYYVVGLKSDAEGHRLAKKVFGKYYWSSGVSYYDDSPSEYGNDWSKAPSKSEFLKLKNQFDN